MTEAPSSRVSSVVSMLGDLTAFAARFLIFGDVIAAGALGIAQFYVFDPQYRCLTLPDPQHWLETPAYLLQGKLMQQSRLRGDRRLPGVLNLLSGLPKR
jgi:hypothetical protein